MVTATAWIQRLSAALVLLTVVSSTAHAQKTDVVRLANGDRLTGEVKSLTKGRLEFSTDDAGTVFLEWDKIVSLEAASVRRDHLGRPALLRQSGGGSPARAHRP